MGKFILFFILAMIAVNGFWYAFAISNGERVYFFIPVVACAALTSLVIKFIASVWED